MKNFPILLFLLAVISPVFASEPGEVVSAHEIFSLNAADVTALEEKHDFPVTEESSLPVPIIYYQVVYYTSGPSGNLTTASGLLIVPNALEPMPLLSFQHGTILKRTDAPSIKPFAKEAILATLLFAARGYSVSMADGLGLGHSNIPFHPFLHSKTEATSSADFLRASLTLAQKKKISLSGQLFLSGYSQGGHWTMALHQDLERNPLPGLKLIASAPMGGPFDLSGTTLIKLLERPGPNTSTYMACLLHAYQRIYGRIIPCWDSVFQRPYAEQIAEFFSGDHSLNYVSRRLPRSPSELFRPEYIANLRSEPHHPLRLALMKNDLYDWTPKAPVFLIHSKGDRESPYENSLKASRKMKSRGAPVELLPLSKHYSHIGGYLPAYLAAAARFAKLRRTYEN